MALENMFFPSPFPIIHFIYCKRLAHPFHADKDDNIPFHLLEKIQI